MTRTFDRPLFRLAALAALVLSLGLAGCGRKGPLDAPPGAVTEVPAQTTRASGLSAFRPPRPAQPQPQQRTGEKPAETVETSFDADGNPIAPKVQRQRFFLDALLD